MDRRKFIASIVLGTAVSMVPGAGAFVKAPYVAADSQRLMGIFSHAESARAVGECYLEKYPQEADLEKLVRGVYGAPMPSLSPEAIVVPARLQEKVKKDFEQGDTVCIEGWVLSRTESRLCTLAALL